jgi:hypothetical protein
MHTNKGEENLTQSRLPPPSLTPGTMADRSSVVPRPHNYGGQVAPSPPLATSAKGTKSAKKKDGECIRLSKAFLRCPSFPELSDKMARQAANGRGLTRNKKRHAKQTSSVVRQPSMRVNLGRKPWSVPRLRGRGKQGLRIGRTHGYAALLGVKRHKS